jgi:hypothetical protein
VCVSLSLSVSLSVCLSLCVSLSVSLCVLPRALRRVDSVPHHWLSTDSHWHYIYTRYSSLELTLASSSTSASNYLRLVTAALFAALFLRPVLWWPETSHATATTWLARVRSEFLHLLQSKAMISHPATPRLPPKRQFIPCIRNDMPALRLRLR